MVGLYVNLFATLRYVLGIMLEALKNYNIQKPFGPGGAGFYIFYYNGYFQVSYTCNDMGSYLRQPVLIFTTVKTSNF